MIRLRVCLAEQIAHERYSASALGQETYVGYSPRVARGMYSPILRISRG
jgi:hypothetical protein